MSRFKRLRSGMCGHLVLGLVTLLIPVSVICAPVDDLLVKLDHHGLVNDYAGVIDPAEEARISNLVDELQRKTTAAIVVVTLRSLEGGDVVDFSGKLFAKWGIGEKGKNNGVLLLASIDDRKLRIEVGYGLEGAINDAKAGRILDEQLIPAFKEQRYGVGLYQASVALAALVAGEYKVDLTNSTVAVSPIVNAAADSSASVLPIVLFFVFAGGIICIAIIARKKGFGAGRNDGPFGGSSSGGGYSGGSSSSSSSSGGFGGGQSGGGGASRSW